MNKNLNQRNTCIADSVIISIPGNKTYSWKIVFCGLDKFGVKMPHCVIECSDRLDSDVLTSKVYLGALASDLFAPDGSDIKVRALAYSSYVVGGAKTDFVHVTVRVLSGRTMLQKVTLSKAIQAKLNELGLVSCSITVEIVDIERTSYLKWLV
jgi:5-carboxymethyl-2-hydroxymuconate isomerase